MATPPWERPHKRNRYQKNELASEGARVEALMKEHTHISKESLDLPVDRLHLGAGGEAAAVPTVAAVVTA